MGATKTQLFTDHELELAALAKSLAHPARISILLHLLKSDACITGDLVQEVGLAQPTVSQHLRELKSAGLIKGTVEGTSVCYCIDGEKWKSVRALFEQLFDAYRERDECC